MSDLASAPEPPAPTTEAAARPGQLPLDRKAFAAWKRRLEQSQRLLDPKIDDWKEAVSAYLGKPLDTLPSRDTIIVNKEYAFLEQKKAQLAFQVPEVQLKPKRPGLEGAVQVFQAALNHELSPDGANVKTTIDECLFDVLACGIAASKIGYQAVIGQRTIEQPTPVIDPATEAPIIDPMTMQPVMEPQPVVVPFLVHEEYFWRRLSPDKLLLPIEFEGEDFDKSPWLAMKFEKDVEVAKVEYDLPETFSGKRRDTLDTLSGEKEDVASEAAAEKVEGVEIWYRASVFDRSELNPRRVRVLTLIDGHDEPVDHRESPYQTEGPDGKLMGMEGFPIHILTLRVVAGSAYPPSDVEIARPVSDELSKGRSQMIQQRDDSRPLRGFDRNRVDPETAHKLAVGMPSGLIPMDGPLQDGVWEIARAQFPRENFTFDQICNRDYEELWAIGPNQRGLSEDNTRTATELNIIQGAANVRLDAERSRVLSWFTTGARKFGALLQMFADDTKYVEVVGEQLMPQLQPWNRQMIAGEYVFDAKPDSALRIDAAQERKQMLDLYNLLARDPNVSRVELLNILFRKFNIDPTRVVIPQLPPTPPEKPAVSVRLTPAELGLPHVVALLEQYGITVTPEMQQAAQGQAMVQNVVEGGTMAPHGGAAPQANPLSKHVLRGDGRDGRLKEPTNAM